MRARPWPHLQRAFQRSREESGSTLIEFAASAILLLTLIFGIMDCSRALYIDHFLANAAREGSRYAMSRGHTFTGTTCTTTATLACEATAANVTSFVHSLVTNGITASAVGVATSWPSTTVSGVSCISGTKVADSPGCTVIVQVTYSFSFVLPFLPKNALAMSSTSTVNIAQ